MSTSTQTCIECGSTSFEFSSEAGRDVCTLCGTLTLINTGFETLGRTLEGEDDEFGRVFLRNGGTSYAGGNARNRDGRTIAKDGTSVDEYHHNKRAGIEQFIRSLLAHFSLSELFQRAKMVFNQAKERAKFRWGKKARVVAAACVYVVSRERERGLPLVDLASIAEIEYGILARAQGFVKHLLGITTGEIDPVVFLDRHVIHLTTLLKSSPNPRLSGHEKKNAWTPSNLVWMRALDFVEVRKLAGRLVTFTGDINLVVARSPEQVSCAVIVMAMEGTARKPAPVAAEIMSELSRLLAVKSSTIAERYRELWRALADFAPTVPWIGEKGRGCNKKLLASYVDDIVKFRKSKMAKLLLAQRGSLVLVEAQAEEDAIEGGNTSQIEGPTSDEEAEEEDDEVELEAYFPDPLSDPKAAAILAGLKENAISAPSQPGGRRLPTVPIPSATTSSPRFGPLDSLIQNAQSVKRPAEYMRNRPDQIKRVRTIERAATALLGSFTSTPGSEVLVSKLAIDSDHPRPGHADPTRTAHNPFPAHSEAAVHYRQLLLAGHDPTAIFEGKNFELEDPSRGGAANRRLTALLWTRTVDEITDEELFAEGEMDALVRTPAEVAILKRSTRFLEIPDPKPYVEPAPKRKYTMRVKRQPKEGSAEGEEEWKKPSKADPGTMDAMAKYFAMEMGDEQGEEGVDAELGLAMERSAIMAQDEIAAELEE